MTTTDVTTGSDEGLDDPALLAEIEAEFAELTKEIERISAMPRTMAPQKSQLVEALRASWRERLEARGDRPEWRQRLDRTIGHAVDRLLEEGIQENPDGSLAFALRGETLQQEGGPLMKGLVEGFAHMMMEKFPAPGTAKVEAPDAPPPTPMQQILGSLGHTLANALQNAVKQFGAGVTPGSSATVGFGGGEMKVDVQARPPEPTADGVGQKATFALEGEQDLSASFEIDTRKQREAARSADASAAGASETSPAQTGDGASSTAGDGGESSGAAAEPSGGAPSPAANAFFQQLFAGLGQAVQQALAPASGSGGLGQLVTQAIAKAFSPPAASTPPASPAAAAPATADAAATASADAAPASTDVKPTPATSTDAPATTDTAPATAPIDAAPAEVAPEVPMLTATESNPKGESPATMQIDLAGLLGQLLGSIKQPPKG